MIWMNYNDLTSWRHCNDGVYLGKIPKCPYDNSFVQVSELVNFNQKLYIYIK